jgi:hypothetical protein
MHIDRSRFLVLAAAIGAGCSAAEKSAPVEVATPSDVPEVPEHQGGQVEPAEVQPRRSESEMIEACQAMQPPAPQCESFDIVVAACTGFARGLAPDSAEAATDCVLTKGKSAELCSGYGSSPSEVVNRCFEAGIAAASSDPSQRESCQSIAQQCGSYGMGTNDLEARCVQAMGAMKPDYRNHLVTCMAEGCSIDYCGFSLSYTIGGF